MQCWCGIYHTDLAGPRHLDAVLRVFMGRAPKERALVRVLRTTSRVTSRALSVVGAGLAPARRRRKAMSKEPRRWAA